MPSTTRAAARRATMESQDTREASDDGDGHSRDETPEVPSQSQEDVVTSPTRTSAIATEDPGRCTLAKGHGTTEGTAAIYFSIYDASAASDITPRPSTMVIDRKDLLASESIHGYGNGEDKIGYWNTRDEVATTESPKEDTLAKGHGTSEGTAAIYFSIYDASAASDITPRPSTKVIDRVVWNKVGLCVYDG